MKNQLMIFTLFGILITSVGVSPVFGEIGSVIISTDKSSYSHGDVILVSGEIKYIALGDQLGFVIYAPNGNITQIDQLTVGSDKQFGTEINTNGKFWKTSGTYTIEITQKENNKASVSFEFTGITVEEVIVEEMVEEVIVEEIIIMDSIITATNITIQGSTDLISYEITNGKVINAIPDLDAVSLLVHIESIDDGSITLTIPRSVLDATINNGDDEFFVLLDGEEVDFEEIITSTDLSLIHI